MSAIAKFTLSADRVELGSWAKAEGLDVTWEVAESSEVKNIIHAPPRSGTLTFRRPRSDSTKISAWHSSRTRTNCTLVMSDASGKPVARYHLENAWPVKVGVATAAMTEEITLTYEHMSRIG